MEYNGSGVVVELFSVASGTGEHGSGDDSVLLLPITTSSVGSASYTLQLEGLATGVDLSLVFFLSFFFITIL